jgi:hypothetical protein
MTKTSKLTGMRNRIKKSGSEKPQKSFIKWVKAEMKSMRPTDVIHFTFDKLMASVFRPAKVSEASAYLFFQRLIRNGSTEINTLGTIVVASSGKSYSFVPRRKMAPKTATPPPVVGNPPASPDTLNRLLNINQFMIGLINNMDGRMAKMDERLSAITKAFDIKEGNAK